MVRIIGNLNPFGHSRRDHSRDKMKGLVLPQYLKRYARAAASVPTTKAVVDDANEKIFAIWFQGRDAAPPLIRACWESVRRHCSQEFLVLDDKTLWDYIDLPGFIMDKFKAGTLRRSHLADIARVELLYNHGGFWLDSTCFATGPIPKYIVDQDFFVFLAGGIVPYSFMQNCFIRARKGAYLLIAWRATMHAYWKNEDRTIDYLAHQLLFRALVQNDPRAIDLFAKMPHVGQDPTHNVWYGKHEAAPFDEKLWRELVKDSFFQKTCWKSDSAKNPPAGSFADAMIKAGPNFPL
ncbi:MAG: capsular polysaccharide synthesis protein [Rickettsiales bacterium]|jgi:hypothetical protein|nr:capsular polysaccharide synthesis protein [Rickettsiales bacterium]